MSPLAQAIAVGLIVAVAAVHAAWRLMPSAMRARWAARVARGVRRFGVSAVDARRVEKKLASRGACGSCDDCGACRTAPDETARGKAIAIVRVERGPAGQMGGR